MAAVGVMTATERASVNWSAIAAELSHLEVITDTTQLSKLSLDYYHFSPVLRPQLQDKRADLVVRPISEADVRQVAQLCVQHKIPLTVRGAGTGNYGQCIPLAGGIVLDMTRMTQIHQLEPGWARLAPGVKLAVFDKQARARGWELRMVPSTYRTATIGGFIGGGSAGIGSITYGQLRDRGNVRAAKVMTLEDEPRLLELRGDAVQQVNHAYGTNGIITELEMALAPAIAWAEVIVTFDEFLDAAQFGQALSNSDGIAKKLVSIHGAPIPGYFTALEPYLPKHQACALLMVADADLEALHALCQEHHGQMTYQQSAADPSKGVSLAEFTWNHTTLHARAVDPSITYLQTFYFTMERVEHFYHYFGNELMMHLEFMRVNGQAIPAGLQLFKFTTEERLQEIIDYHEANGAVIANPHTYILEDGGRKVVDPEQLAFKAQVDPYGLMNPGKMRAWFER